MSTYARTQKIKIHCKQPERMYVYACVLYFCEEELVRPGARQEGENEAIEATPQLQRQIGANVLLVRHNQHRHRTG